MSVLRPLRRFRLIDKAVRRLLWVRETWDAAQSVRDRRGLGTFQILAEQLRLYQRYGLDQYAYFWYRLFEKSLPYTEKIRYLPDSVAANARLWSLLTPECYRCLFDNKLVFNLFFCPLGLPVARIYGVYDPEVGATATGEPLRSAADLRECILRHGDEGFVFKPVEGIQGHNILVFIGRAEEDTLLTLRGERYDAEALVQFAGSSSRLEEHNPGANPVPFLLEERIRPHPRLADFIGPTLCSVRVQTLIARNGKPEIIAAVFKLQPGVSGVDQLVHGAVGCWVDLDTGRLGRGRSRSTWEDVTVIPGTDTPFSGFQLPDWTAIKDVALRAAGAFPWARSIGWDVGVSDRGPVLIEGNERWSPSLIQMPAPAGLLTGELAEVCHSLRDKR
jgi:hypothetical protein